MSFPTQKSQGCLWVTLSCTVDPDYLQHLVFGSLWVHVICGTSHGPLSLLTCWATSGWSCCVQFVQCYSCFMAGGQYTKRGYSGFSESVLYGCTVSRFKHYTSLIPSHLRQPSCLLSTFLDLLPFISLGIIPVFQPDTHSARMVICILSLYWKAVRMSLFWQNAGAVSLFSVPLSWDTQLTPFRCCWTYATTTGCARICTRVCFGWHSRHGQLF